MAAGENIAYTSKGYGVNAKAVSQMWYNSPGHRANMLSGSYGKIGIGIAVADNGDIYYTQLFTN
ncbi:MAG: CAP domain-containing protein [Roseburia sp.]|nr:CAP domain-containing protein [Roseburia sp.]